MSLSLTLALHRFFTYFSMSKAFLSSKSDKSRYCLCLVMSNLLEKNGLTPLSCMMHFPPSMTAISSWLINSMQHCQVMSLIFHTKKAGTSSNLCFLNYFLNLISYRLPLLLMWISYLLYITIFVTIFFCKYFMYNIHSKYRHFSQILYAILYKHNLFLISV